MGIENLNAALSTAKTAARDAGRILREMQGRITAREKGPADLVTEADLAAQAAIEQRLCAEFPNFGFQGEESEAGSDARADGDQPCWVVDPLDGTTNYVHGLDNYSVSIGLRHHDRLLIGVVFDPVRNEMFTATANSPTQLNGSDLHVSKCQSLGESLIAASFSARVDPNSPQIDHFIRMMGVCRALRRLGSAALNLCYVAAGRMGRLLGDKSQTLGRGSGAPDRATGRWCDQRYRRIADLHR